MTACAVCSAELPESAGTGRPRAYCSHACRERACRGVTKPRSGPGVQSDQSGPAGAAGRARARSLTLVEVAAGIPTPVDPRFGPARAYVDVRADLRYGVHFLVEGNRRQIVDEPTFRTPRPAMKLADLLNARLVPARAESPVSAPRAGASARVGNAAG